MDDSSHEIQSIQSNISLMSKSDQNSGNSFKSYVLMVISGLFSSLFLAILMTFALFHRLWVYLTTKKLESPSFQPAYPTSTKLRMVPELRYYLNVLGLDLVEYKLTTQDGFIITVNRIVNPAETDDERNAKVPVLCVHGLLQSSGSFVTSGYKSLAYYLVQNNYDVWLGNNRCGFEPQHIRYESSDPRMWQWDISEMALYDLPCMVDHVLSVSNHKKVALLCHSQGTTETFIGLHRIPDILNHKVSIFFGLAPAVFGGSLLDEKLFIRFINSLPASMYSLFFGHNSFMPVMMTFRKLIYKHNLFGFLSYAMFNFLFDWDNTLWDKSIMGQHFLFSPVYVSSQLMRWWLSKDGFVDSKSILPEDSEWFDETSPRIVLFVPKLDRLVDGERLIRHLETKEPFLRSLDVYRLDSYSHLDVLWAEDVIQTVGERVIETLMEGEI